MEALDALLDLVLVDVPNVLVVLAPSQLQVEPSVRAHHLERVGADAEDIDVDRPNRALRAWAEARGVPLLDLTEPLRARVAAGDGVYRPNDTHWNLAGNEVAGREVGRWLALRALGDAATASGGP